MKTRILIPIMLGLMALSLSSCRHKDLFYEVNDRSEIYVVFDWRNAPDANPSSMLAYFYPAGGGSELLYPFADITGGSISIPFGYYSAIAVNGDNTDLIGMRHTDDPEMFEVFTRDAETLEANAIASRSVPRAAGAEGERMAKTPCMIWADRSDNIRLDAESDGEGRGVHVITFYPEEAVCHYTVDVVDITHPEYLDGAEVDATLSGMAEGYRHWSGKATDVAVTMPFVLRQQEASGQSLHASFLTFGECATTLRRHLLTVYVYLTDGTKWYHTFDVTDQVAQAPDPRNVHIIVRGLDLPQPIAGGSGFKPDVNEWNSIDIDIPM